MIISKEVRIKIGNKNFHQFRSLGYEFDGVGDTILSKLEDISYGSKVVIDVSCDYCGACLKVPYKRYNLNTRVVNKYACAKKECSNQKIKDVCMVKYGVENPFQAEFVKEKSKETLNEKYGVDHQMYLESTKEKIRETCIDKFGVDSYTKTKECQDKIRETCTDQENRDISLKGCFMSEQQLKENYYIAFSAAADPRLY